MQTVMVSGIFHCMSIVSQMWSDRKHSLCAEPYRGQDGFPMFCQSNGQGIPQVQEGCESICMQGEVK